MWWKAFKDYPAYRPMKNQQIESGKGIVGCEMHDLGGWGEEHHRQTRSTRSWMETSCAFLFGTKVASKDE